MIVDIGGGAGKLLSINQHIVCGINKKVNTVEE
jgi:hypothetical protein